MVRWGGDLGLGEDIFGTPREEGQAGLRVCFMFQQWLRLRNAEECVLWWRGVFFLGIARLLILTALTLEP